MKKYDETTRVIIAIAFTFMIALLLFLFWAQTTKIHNYETIDSNIDAPTMVEPGTGLQAGNQAGK